ncbi:hypothetical protein GDO81_030045 [Engystomops pustulosus]|uniref:Secreted protein n=1 Tax=Engystomops pustulosus TaxID=76066 RepID=A0AAV6YBF1_ENGPU|nr:hypothetical protein GDO81_030045 [Engystomops pustulosus]
MVCVYIYIYSDVLMTDCTYMIALIYLRACTSFLPYYAHSFQCKLLPRVFKKCLCHISVARDPFVVWLHYFSCDINFCSEMGLPLLSRAMHYIYHAKSYRSVLHAAC